MTANIFHPTLERQVAKHSSQIRRTHQKPGAFRWVTPDCDEGEGDDLCTGDEPALENGWAQPDAPLERFAFRLHSDGSLEFKGHLDSTGASSGSIAVTLPGANAGEHNYIPAKDQFFITVIYDGSTPQNAMVYIDSTTGEVTITFPV